MSTHRCSNCGHVDEISSSVVPPEPPEDTWVKDRHGAAHHRKGDGWGSPGFYYFGKWEAMWNARGPLVECGPWGQDLEDKKE